MTKEEFINYLTDEPCRDALNDFDEFSQPYDPSEPFEKVLTDFFLNHPKGGEYFWWCWDNRLPEQFKTDELINKCALEEPWCALVFCSQRLDDEMFKRCALKRPWHALIFCSQRLDDETFKTCALEEPLAALKYCSQRLDDELFKEFALKYPQAALKYCSKRLDDLGEEFKEELRKKLS